MNNETDLLRAMNIIGSLTTLSRRICDESASGVFVSGSQFESPAIYRSAFGGIPEASTLLNVHSGASTSVVVISV
jgi:hypothetical protein